MEWILSSIGTSVNRLGKNLPCGQKNCHGQMFFWGFYFLLGKFIFTLGDFFSKFFLLGDFFTDLGEKISNRLVTLIATFHPSINLAPRYFISPVQTYRLVHRQLTNYPNLIIDLRLRLRAWKIFINKTFLFLGPSSCWTRKPLNFFEVLMTVFVSLLDLKSFEKWIVFFSVWSRFFCVQLFLEVHFN